MRQYFAAKQQHPDCLMFCRIGDFYELFYDDAILVARELQLTLTARDREKKQPMCGVPYHAAEIYLQRLLRKGYRIALCEQMEDPKQVKTIVRREVTRVLTPGTSVDPSLGPEQSNYLASIAMNGTGNNAKAGLALLDLSTGEFRATEFNGASAWTAAIDELGRIRPVELIHALGLFGPSTGGLLSDKSSDGNSSEESAGLEYIRTRTPVEEWVFTGDYALP
jgi:DNA mismatch repair protein MutS